MIAVPSTARATWRHATLGDFVGNRGSVIDPTKMPDHTFELYSVPSHPSRRPERANGRDIGSSKQVVQPRSVLLCKINPRINRVWVVGNFTENAKIASTEWLVFPPHEDIVPEFLCYFLQRDELRDFLASNASGVGGSLMRVKNSTLANFPFSYPNTVEQQLIVEQLDEQFSRLDAGIAALKRAQVNLKRYRASVLKAACEGRLVPTESELYEQATERYRTNPNEPEPSPYESGEQLLARILEERRRSWSGKGKYKEPATPDSATLTKLPLGWTWTSWESLLAPASEAFKRGPFGSAIKKGMFVPDGYAVYEQYNAINNDHSRVRYFLSEADYSRLIAFSVQAGDFLISCSGTIGRMVRIPAEFRPGVINQALLRVRINSDFVTADYFECIITSRHFQDALLENSTGSAMANVKGVAELKAIPIAVPPIGEQERIVAEVERRLSLADQLEAMIIADLSRAARLRQSILARVFRGEP